MNNNKNNDKNYVGLSIFAFFLFLVLIVFFSSFYIINPGQRGIVLTWGNPNPIPSSEGLHFKIPIAQSVVKINIQTQKYEADASSSSSDLQIVSTKIAVNYHLSGEGVVELYKNIGVNYQDKIIQPAVQEVVKACTAKFNAEALITQREQVKECIDVALKERLYNKGIFMETSSITNFDFSAQFNQAIEAKVTAEQDALTQKNKLAQIQYEAQQAKASAEGQRDAKIAQAEGDAKAIELTAKAEAQKVELIQEQLKSSPQYIEYLKANKWNGQVPSIVLGGNSIPMFQLPSGVLNN